MICHIGETVSKKFKGLRCAYCAVREAVTGDHIFAREFVFVYRFTLTV